MFKSKNYQKKLIILSLLASFIPTTVNAVPVKFSEFLNAQKPQSSNNSQNFATSFRPPNKGQPQHTVGGATRGGVCAIEQKDQSKITALVPEKAQSLTLQSHPTFFAYIDPMNGDKSATLVVKDQNEDYYYSQRLMLPATGGVIKMTLAEDAPPLEVGKSYIWSLRIQCNDYLEPEDPYISATITRVQGDIPPLTQDELMKFYANAQIWYDSLNSAFEFSKSGKSIYWSELLRDIGMEKFTIVDPKVPVF